MKAEAQSAVQFPVRTYDFGTITEDTDSVTCKIDVVNSGNKPLIIEGVHVNCGCVSATNSTRPIAPGGKGYITATLYPKGKEGTTLKSIYVYTNTIPRKNVVRVKAFVVPAKNE